MRLASDQIGSLSHITDSQVFDTFRLLIDSMDYSDEDGDGWEVLCELSLASDGDVALKVLLWMIPLLEFELKTNVVERHFAFMLDWLRFFQLQPERLEASDLLLNLGGHGIINATWPITNGYPVLHRVIAYSDSEDDVSAMVARGADLHLRGFNPSHTPFEESPTSLAMYSAWAFSNWLHALANVDVDLAKFIDQELKLNPEVHAGWEKETLLELFAHGDRPDLHHGHVWTCSDFLEEYVSVIVQPYWRHLLGRIKGRMRPYDPVTTVSEVDENEYVDLGSPGDAANSSTDLTLELDTTGNVPLPKPNENPTQLESELESESNVELEELEAEPDASEHSAMTLGESVCLYGKHEYVCIKCWLHYERTGTRRQPGEPAADKDSSENEDSSSSADSSECEYSPFLIHS